MCKLHAVIHFWQHVDGGPLQTKAQDKIDNPFIIGIVLTSEKLEREDLKQLLWFMFFPSVH